MPQKERLRVFKGELKKTSGGLTKGDLIKNKRGKIVSRRKSTQAVGDENNLGSWLRGKGDKFQGKPKGYKKDAEKDEKEEEKLAEVPVQKPKPKPKLRLKLQLPKPAAAPKQRPKKTRNAPMVAGEKKDYGKVSVGNIQGAADKKKDAEAAEARFRKDLKDEGMTDAQIEKILSGGSSRLAAKVRKLLKASKRRGKRRTKKQLLQDVLDL